MAKLWLDSIWCISPGRKVIPGHQNRIPGTSEKGSAAGSRIYTCQSRAPQDQLNSFAAQNRYYTELISKKPEWTMVDIYADEGITGTSTEKRDDFQRMMADCRRGRKLDQILVKSISRFARNTKELS